MDNSNSTIDIPFKRSSKSKNMCIICKSSGSMVVILAEAKLQAFVEHSIIIQGKMRCCKRHLNGKYFKDSDSKRIRIASEKTTINGEEVTKLLNDLRVYAQKGLLDFDTPGGLSDTDNLRLTGISASDFNDLFEFVKSYIRNTSARSARNCLAILLMKLRTGLSHAVLSTLLEYREEQSVRQLSQQEEPYLKILYPQILAWSILREKNL